MYLRDFVKDLVAIKTNKILLENGDDRFSPY